MTHTARAAERHGRGSSSTPAIGAEIGASDRAGGAERGPRADSPGHAGVRDPKGARESRDVVERIRVSLVREVGQDRFQRYFDEGTTLQADGARLEVTVRSGFLADYIDRQFGGVLRKAAESAGLGDPQHPVTVRFRVNESAPAATPRQGDDTNVGPGRHASGNGPASLQNVARAGDASGQVRRPSTGSKRSPSVGALRHRLEEFVVGASNRLAHAAAVRVADSAPGDKFSPLFIHGHCGLGKSHLLQGLAYRFIEKHPQGVVRYLTAEEFTNEYVQAIKSNRLDQFRRTYRGVDLLCLDDAHFLSAKEKTQTELLHTFDAIDLSGARIVLASDDHPREIKKMSEQLISRFVAGAVVRLDPPDDELRGRMIRHLAAKRGLPMEDAAVALLVERGGRAGPGATPGTVRDLEGMMTQVEAMFRLMPEMAASGTVGVVLVRKALGLSESDGATTSGRPRRPIQAERINAEVCRALGVSLQEMMGVGRHPKVVLARSVIAYLTRKLTTMSFPEIARAMGRPNHSTVITAQKRFAAVVEGNASTDSTQWAGADLGPAFAGMTARDFVDRLARDLARGE